MKWQVLFHYISHTASKNLTVRGIRNLLKLKFCNFLFKSYPASIVPSIFELLLLKWTWATIHFKICLISHDAFLNSVQEFVIIHSFPVCLFDQLMKQMHKVSRFGEFTACLQSSICILAFIQPCYGGTGFLLVCLFFRRERFAAVTQWKT